MSVAVEQIVIPYHQTDRFSLYEGDCRSVLPIFADAYFDSVVCDPPYELGFMGKGWDRSGIAYDVSVWRECLRVLKPGGHLLAFGGSRTYHRLACAIEDAGFEIRDQIQWIYGSGFPKSLDVSKAIDAAAGAEREVVGVSPFAGRASDSQPYKQGERGAVDVRLVTTGATDAAKQWDGWGTALKPAHEPIVLARKPLIGTVAENVLQHGTGGLNIVGCRVGTFNDGAARSNTPGSGRMRAGGSPIDTFVRSNPSSPLDENIGRWPANVIHDGSEEVLSGFPDSVSRPHEGAQLSGERTHEGWKREAHKKDFPKWSPHDDAGSAARFFYCAKADNFDRNEGLEDMLKRAASVGDERASGQMNQRLHGVENRKTLTSANHHPTVKPTDLMRYLCRLITPPSGLVLDPFCGSGSTGKAAMLEGLRFVGIELSAEYCELAQRRIEAVTKQGLLFA